MSRRSRHDEQSLEELAERMARREAEHDEDPEADLDDLIAVLVHEHPGPVADGGPPHADEFTCRSCHLVQHRSRLADPYWMFCADCTARLA